MKRICATAIALSAALAPVWAAAGPATADPRPGSTGYGQPIDTVIQRALSQRGVPYVYGGGNIAGPTAGAPSRPTLAPTTLGPTLGTAATLPGLSPAPAVGGPAIGSPALGSPAIGSPVSAPAGIPGLGLPQTVGFDASGLIQYAFAGAGIKMPRTSGEQCSVGHKVAPAQARPGDLLCYGPGGTQSVALYLGNNQMIEGTNPAVTVSPARTSNMVPYLTRVIGQ
ncbi:NlpC/P60 family peptidoglycan-binding protein RipD [Mycobacterium sp. M1]|uniref:NlpC/P60 family peptidoglycan-binding protein RipD n=1 Tax=Mycolicibacter acidiphilus TaxID=2835306 RepID=A0ABS5RJ86_9MYCO|nr:NlpC/P60 family peptidoglycan-binding protein RipD [Mycolicibacter acidiphilus]MBS9534311.1 NlpC/P60 family peptidoglycan-binding protein RipD [Mycolicibacter acidiphilus]